MLKSKIITRKLVLIMTLFIGINIVSAKIFIPMIPYGIYIFLSVLMISFIVVTLILSKQYAYICGNCHKKFNMKYSQILSHYAGIFRKLECPYCHEETWCEPIKRH